MNIRMLHANKTDQLNKSTTTLHSEKDTAKTHHTCNIYMASRRGASSDLIAFRYLQQFRVNKTYLKEADILSLFLCFLNKSQD